jgi:hypothetical protein
MRELNVAELQHISGGSEEAMSGDAMLGFGFAGLAVSIPVIIGGAILGVPTLGLGFAAMAVGIFGTTLSGAMAIFGLVTNIIDKARSSREQSAVSAE